MRLLPQRTQRMQRKDAAVELSMAEGKLVV